MNLGSFPKSCCDRLAKPYLHKASGAVAAIVTPADTVYRAYGRIDAERPAPPDPATLFEIGSITKVFTAILLAKMSLDGRIDPDRPIGNISREFAGAPAWITPRALATHSAGLPRIPFSTYEILKIGSENPYAVFGRADLVQCMARYRPKKAPKPGRPPSYSNLGMGLLGELLAMVATSPFETLLTTEILAPLGLNDTVISLSDDQRRRLATPHRSGDKPTSPWDFDALAGAGALRSTARDLVAFCAAAIDAAKGEGPLHPAIAKSLEVQVFAPHPSKPDQCFGWSRMPVGPGPTRAYAHDGGTRGSLSALFVVPEAGVAMLVLANQGFTLWRAMRAAHSNPDGILRDVLIFAESQREEPARIRAGPIANRGGTSGPTLE